MPGKIPTFLNNIQDRIGAITGDPAEYTIAAWLKGINGRLDDLKDIMGINYTTSLGTYLSSLVDATGEVQASPTANTVLDRLKTLNTSVAAVETDVEALAGLIGEVQDSPTSYTSNWRLKTIYNAIAGIASAGLQVELRTDPTDTVDVASVDLSASGNILAGTAAQKIYLYGIIISSDDDDAVVTVSWTSTPSASNTILKGHFMAGGGANMDFPIPVKSGTNEALYLTLSGGTNVYASIRYKKVAD